MAMMFHRLGLINKNQLGLSLLELMLAFTISAIIIGAVTITINQVITGNLRTGNHMAAVRQVQDAGYWVSHDAHMIQAEPVIGDDPETPGVTEFLVFNWSDWGSNYEHQAVYTLEDIPGSDFKNLLRTHTYSSTTDSGIIAEFIDLTLDEDDEPKTSCAWDGSALTFKVTATVGTGTAGQTETRTYEVFPRAIPE